MYPNNNKKMVCILLGQLAQEGLGFFSGPETGKRTRVTRKADGKLTPW